MSLLSCAICQNPLHLEGRSYRCCNNHCFDVAKEGYVNLLPVQHKKSKQPGDSKPMLLSRRRFLEAGYYQTLQQQITDLFRRIKPQSALDLGCGEGYYSHGVHQAQLGISWSAIDIAKAAVQMTAKRKYADYVVVASAYELPFASNSFDAVLCVFSPIDGEALRRVCKPNAQVILVEPAARHLSGLAAQVYDEVNTHEGNKRGTQSLHGFELVEQQHVSETIEVANEYVADLLQMTPYYWQCSEAKQQAVANLPSLTTEIDFQISLYAMV